MISRFDPPVPRSRPPETRYAVLLVVVLLVVGVALPGLVARSLPTTSGEIELAVLSIAAIGAAASVATAVVVVVLAIKMRRALATERRVAFELQILRELLQALNYDAVRSPRVRAQLACLPPDELPLWRAGAEAGARDRDVREALEAALRSREAWPRDQVSDRWPLYALADELQQSIALRLGSSD